MTYYDNYLQLLHSLDEDDRSVPESPILPKDKDTKDIRKDVAHGQSPMRHSSLPAVAVTPLPVSASPNTNSKFISKGGPNGQLKNSPIKVIIHIHHLHLPVVPSPYFTPNLLAN